MIRIVLVGANGRMGKTVQALVQEKDVFTIAYAIDPSLGTSFTGFTGKADVVIDFATPAVVQEEVSFCIAHALPLILASTGHSETINGLLEEAAQQIAILWSPNLSSGAYVLSKLATSAHILLKGYDSAIVETHHRAKADAPSGTAKRLAEMMDMPQMPMHSIRGGAVVGTHEVAFYGNEDIITLRHEALDRRLFANGSLEAAKWIVNCAPGLYDMSDFLG